MHRWTLVCLLAGAACVGDDPGAGAAGGDAGPLADAGFSNDGGADGAACAAAARCTDDLSALQTCNGLVACALGCNPQGRCQQIVPSGAAGQTDTNAASANVVLAAAPNAYVVDTATGSIGQRDADGNPIGVPVRSPGVGVNQGIEYAVVAQPDGAPQVAVFAFASLTLASGATIRVAGPHAVALVSRGDVELHGDISVRADCINGQPGAGGFAHDLPAAVIPGLPTAGGAVERETVEGNRNICGGGGGGGNGGAGGGGGQAQSINPPAYAEGGSGGSARASLLLSPVLAGGAGGSLESGGAGGGALHLVSSGSILVSGTIDGGGCGGQHTGGGPHDGRVCSSPGGGGAGGTVFFEAGIVRLEPTARVLLNGGAGGGGKNQDVYPVTGTSGADGSSTDVTPAAGGSSTTADATTCPSGQIGNPPALGTGPDGVVRECVGDLGVSASGGGGGAGHIAARTYTGAIDVAAGALLTVSPVHDLATTR